MTDAADAGQPAAGGAGLPGLPSVAGPLLAGRPIAQWPRLAAGRSGDLRSN